jgi:hypothetical protein
MRARDDDRQGERAEVVGLPARVVLARGAAQPRLRATAPCAHGPDAGRVGGAFLGAPLNLPLSASRPETYSRDQAPACRPRKALTMGGLENALDVALSYA